MGKNVPRMDIKTWLGCHSLNRSQARHDVFLVWRFAALMLLFRELMYVNIAITVVYVYAVFFMLYRQAKSAETTL